MSDRRKYERYLIQKFALLRLTNGETIEGQTRNMGEGGVFVECASDSELTPGDTCQIRLVLDDDGEDSVTEVEGSVSYSTSQGVGLNFLKVNSVYYQFIDELSD